MLTWALFCIVQAPEVEAKLRAEIDAVLGDRVPGACVCVCCTHASSSGYAAGHVDQANLTHDRAPLCSKLPAFNDSCHI